MTPDPACPSDTDEAMMRRALRLAEQAAEQGEVPVGAVVYETETGTVLAEAANRRETDRDPSAHAEFIAIRAASSLVIIPPDAKAALALPAIARISSFIAST